MSYSTSCKAAALLFVVLFILLLFVPAFIFWLFGVPQSETGSFIARRAAMLFLGLAVISWQVKSAPPSSFRNGFSLGIGLSMAAMAGIGIFEFLRGFAQWPILLAVMVEGMIGIIFLRHAQGDKAGR